MFKWLLRGHFGHLNFKTFPLIQRTPQCEVFWPLQSSSEFSWVPEDSKSPLLGVWVSFSHLAQSGVVTKYAIIEIYFNSYFLSSSQKRIGFCEWNKLMEFFCVFNVICFFLRIEILVSTANGSKAHKDPPKWPCLVFQIFK
jgi:hypothetical protein